MTLGAVSTNSLGSQSERKSEAFLRQQALADFSTLLSINPFEDFLFLRIVRWEHLPRFTCSTSSRVHGSNLNDGSFLAIRVDGSEVP